MFDDGQRRRRSAVALDAVKAAACGFARSAKPQAKDSLRRVGIDAIKMMQTA